MTWDKNSSWVKALASSGAAMPLFRIPIASACSTQFHIAKMIAFMHDNEVFAYLINPTHALYNWLIRFLLRNKISYISETTFTKATYS